MIVAPKVDDVEDAGAVVPAVAAAAAGSSRAEAVAAAAASEDADAEGAGNAAAGAAATAGKLSSAMSSRARGPALADSSAPARGPPSQAASSPSPRHLRGPAGCQSAGLRLQSNERCTPRQNSHWCALPLGQGFLQPSALRPQL